MKISENKIKQARALFKKMVSDKRAITVYIREHGTLDGFEKQHKDISFAKPI